MPRFVSKDGNHVVETSVATEAAELRRDGFTEQKARTAAVREADAVAQAEPAKSPKSN
ncbi:hypothetical protein SEA_ABBYDAISY_14 [Arthrobacter phage AbbyDaisy]|nr:hypothetical protein SEA_ABBYDAISY_14 [Arthrobacter phage AbbyDaisy]